jgi:hypothetical protein
MRVVRGRESEMRYMGLGGRRKYMAGWFTKYDVRDGRWGSTGDMEGLMCNPCPTGAQGLPRLVRLH